MVMRMTAAFNRAPGCYLSPANGRYNRFESRCLVSTGVATDDDSSPPARALIATKFLTHCRAQHRYHTQF